MSKVLVLGATGFIGLPIATAFARRGYTVYGLTRSESKAQELLKNEDTAIWESYAKEADVVVEAVADYEDTKTGDAVRDVLVNLLKEDKAKIVFYTSGTWVYGNVAPGSTAATETSPINPPSLVSWRPQMDKAYLEAGGIVMRAGLLFGKSGSITSSVFASIQSGKAELFGSGTQSWGLVHTDDLAEAYVLAVERASVARGQIYNLVGSNENVGDVAKAIAAVSGFKGEIKFIPPPNPFAECLCLQQRISSAKARTELGWNPRHTSFVDGISIYYKSWKSFQ